MVPRGTSKKTPGCFQQEQEVFSFDKQAELSLMLDSVLSQRAETHAVVGELVLDSGGPVTGL